MLRCCASAAAVYRSASTIMSQVWTCQVPPALTSLVLEDCLQHAPLIRLSSRGRQSRPVISVLEGDQRDLGVVPIPTAAQTIDDVWAHQTELSSKLQPAQQVSVPTTSDQVPSDLVHRLDNITHVTRPASDTALWSGYPLLYPYQKPATFFPHPIRFTQQVRTAVCVQFA